MARNINHRRVNHPGVNITSTIEIYWRGEDIWTTVCLDTVVIWIEYWDPSSGSAEVIWQGNRWDGGRKEVVWWRLLEHQRRA